MELVMQSLAPLVYKTLITISQFAVILFLSVFMNKIDYLKCKCIEK